MTYRRAALWLVVCLSVSAGPVLSAPASECPPDTPEVQRVLMSNDSDTREDQRVLMAASDSDSPEDQKALMSNDSDTRESQQVLVPSDSDCAEFYICADGVPHLMTCSGLLYFNNATGRCDYRGNVDCDIPEPAAAPPASSGAPGLSDGRPLSEDLVGSDTNPACLQQVSPFLVLLPNPANCSTYYTCTGGVAMLMPCPEGLLFNNDTWTCDHPRKVVCPELNQVRDTDVKSDRPLATRLSVGETPPPSDQCPQVDGQYPVLLPNRDDSSSFYMCTRGVAFLEQCPAGQLFNNNTRNCGYPENIVAASMVP